MAPRKALVIVLGYETLKSSRMAVTAARPVLEDRGYTVTIMSDCEGTSEDLIPTRKNIMRELKGFIEPKVANARHVFLYCGHAGSKLDGTTYISPIHPFGESEQSISDTELKTLLVDRLHSTGSLFAMFDACHSGNMLRLPHTEPTLLQRLFPWFYASRLKVHHDSGPQVVCISACKADECVYDFPNNSIIKVAMNFLRRMDSNSTLKTLMNDIRHVVRTGTQECERDERDCDRRDKANGILVNREPVKSHPQLTSLQPMVWSSLLSLILQPQQRKQHPLV